MLKPSFSKVIVAALLLGSVQAASAFPKAADEVQGAWYAQTIPAPVQTTPASRATFPVTAVEHGSSHETYVEARPSRIGASIMGALRAMFPQSGSETSPLSL